MVNHLRRLKLVHSCVAFTCQSRPNFCVRGTTFYQLCARDWYLAGCVAAGIYAGPDSTRASLSGELWLWLCFWLSERGISLVHGGALLPLIFINLEPRLNLTRQAANYWISLPQLSGQAFNYQRKLKFFEWRIAQVEKSWNCFFSVELIEILRNHDCLVSVRIYDMMYVLNVVWNGIAYRLFWLVYQDIKVVWYIYFCII